MQPQRVFTNGRVTLGSDLVFGVVVLAHEGWIPVAYLEPVERNYIKALLDYNPTCPPDFVEALRA